MFAVSLLLLPVLVTATCYSYQAQDPPQYCDVWVTWPVSDSLDPWTQSHKAYQQYYKLKEKYLAGGPKAPTLDCLAIAMEFYCSFEFPYCASDQDPSRGICSFLCNLYQSRCPNEVYDYYCSVSPTSSCSLATMLHTAGGLLTLIYFLA